MNPTDSWNRLPVGVRAAAIAVLAGLVVFGAAFAFGMSGGDQPTGQPQTQPATTQQVPTFTPPPATHVSPKPVPSATDDDGATNTSPSAVPTDPIRDAATSFVLAWLNTYRRTADEWRANLGRHVTSELAEALKDADPATVPVGVYLTGSAKVTVVADGIADVEMAVVNNAVDRANPQPLGTVTATLVDRGGRWLVSEIDWQPV